MTWKKIATVVMALCAAFGAARVALALTPGQTECCLVVMDEEATVKYYGKHIKTCGKCTLKVDDSTKPNPEDEKCFAGMAIATGAPDWVLEKFKEKAINKARKKCTTKLNITEAQFDTDPTLVIPSPCGCNTASDGTLSLKEQMECKLAKVAGPADDEVCAETPALKNSNRGDDTRPAQANFCETLP